jgi:hypothetical protein
MWQAILVGLIVIVAVLYAGWRLLPAVARQRLAQVFTTWARRPGRPAWLGRVASALETGARGGQGACSDCSAVQGPPLRRGTTNPPPPD